jgi:hypothetical protein
MKADGNAQHKRFLGGVSDNDGAVDAKRRLFVRSRKIGIRKDARARSGMIG